MFCAASRCSRTADLAAGGNPYDTRTSAFDRHVSWQALANMNTNRWYATLLELPSNELFTTFANAGATPPTLQPGEQRLALTPAATMQDLLNEQNAENGQTAVNTASDLQWWARWPWRRTGASFTAVRPRRGICSTRAAADRCNRSAAGRTRTRMWGNAVTYGAGKVLILGGSDRTQTPRDQRGYKIDLNGPSPVISNASPMAYRRAYRTR